jgi:hypothetical protein
VLAIALAKTVDDRFSSAGALAAAFVAALDGTLDRDVRRRGDALVARHAWNTRIS